MCVCVCVCVGEGGSLCICPPSDRQATSPLTPSFLDDKYLIGQQLAYPTWMPTRHDANICRNIAPSLVSQTPPRVSGSCHISALRFTPLHPPVCLQIIAQRQLRHVDKISPEYLFHALTRPPHRHRMQQLDSLPTTRPKLSTVKSSAVDVRQLLCSTTHLAVTPATTLLTLSSIISLPATSLILEHL